MMDSKYFGNDQDHWAATFGSLRSLLMSFLLGIVLMHALNAPDQQIDKTFAFIKLLD